MKNVYDGWCGWTTTARRTWSSPAERGFFLHPELHGQPAERSTIWATHPELMERDRHAS